MLNEIREEYKIKDNEMREELHRKCRFTKKFFFKNIFNKFYSFLRFI
jgi:hypothetical protein